MYNVSRCSQGSAHRASSSLLAEKGMYLDQRRAQNELILHFNLSHRDEGNWLRAAVALELQAHDQNRAAGV